MRAALVLFAGYVAAHLAFAVLVYSGTFHHHAHIFVAWLAALWVLRAAAESLGAHGVPAARVLGAWSTPTATVGAFLARPLYAADRARTGTYIHWDVPVRVQGREAVQRAALAEAGARSEVAGGPVVVILSGGLTVTPAPHLDVRELVRFDGAIKSGESYVLYNVRCRRTLPGPPTSTVSVPGG